MESMEKRVNKFLELISDKETMAEEKNGTAVYPIHEKENKQVVKL